MEFENLQIEVPLDDETESQLYGVKVYEKKYTNKNKDFVVGFNPKSKEFIERKAKRAQRFGIKETEQEDGVVETDMDLFSSIELNKLEWPDVPDEALEEMRTDAILLYGVSDLSTKDVFAYFDLYGPETIEWIDDLSCNVVWEDDVGMMRALDGVSKTYAALKLHRAKAKAAAAAAAAAAAVDENTDVNIEEIVIKEETEGDEEEDGEHRTDTDNNPIEVDINPKDVWRIGLPFKEHQLFLRPATIKDKKLPGAAQRSEYYLKYGKNPESENTPGVLSKSRKRKLEQMKKLADERFKNKEPDVKICDLVELKDEGLIHKMEVDDEGQPAIKRPSNVRPNPMSMMADRIELGDKLGYATAETVHERLGSPTTNRKNGSIHDRLGQRVATGGSVHDRLGTRSRNEEQEGDARNDILSNRSKRNNTRNHPVANRLGYEDDDGVYHDIYRADDVKSEDDGLENSTKSRYGRDDEDSDDNDDDENERSRRFKHRSERFDRTTSESTKKKTLNRQQENGGGDLRAKLSSKNRNKNTSSRAPAAAASSSSLTAKKNNGTFDGEKLNLCIEIKQEPKPVKEREDNAMDIDDENFEF